MKTINYNGYECYIRMGSSYPTGNMVLSLVLNEEPLKGIRYGYFTKDDIRFPLEENCAFVDVMGYPCIINILEKEGLAKDSGHRRKIGPFVYPLYSFDMDRLKEYMEL